MSVRWRLWAAMTADHMHQFREALWRGAPALSGDVLDKLCTYYDLLMEANQSMNLTADEAPEQVASRHYLDSLAPPALEILQPGCSVVDVGTGAGFPGLVLAILRPDISFTLLDSLQKRIAFLQRVTEKLELSNVRCIAARAEDAARTELREHFDFALSRAVAALPVLLEYTLPFVRVGGSALCWKGPTVSQEVCASSHALKVLGAGEYKLLSYSPDGLREYTILQVHHIRPCPTLYPRKAGIPTKKPL